MYEKGQKVEFYNGKETVKGEYVAQNGDRHDVYCPKDRMHYTVDLDTPKVKPTNLKRVNAEKATDEVKPNQPVRRKKKTKKKA